MPYDRYDTSTSSAASNSGTQFDGERLMDRIHETDRAVTGAVAAITIAYLEQNEAEPGDLAGLVMALRVAFGADVAATQKMFNQETAARAN